MYALINLNYVGTQAASFNYDLVYKVCRAISDEVRAKVGIS